MLIFRIIGTRSGTVDHLRHLESLGFCRATRTENGGDTVSVFGEGLQSARVKAQMVGRFHCFHVGRNLRRETMAMHFPVGSQMPQKTRALLPRPTEPNALGLRANRIDHASPIYSCLSRFSHFRTEAMQSARDRIGKYSTGQKGRVSRTGFMHLRKKSAP